MVTESAKIKFVFFMLIVAKGRQHFTPAIKKSIFVSYFIFAAKIRVYFLTSEPTIKKNKKKYNFLDLC